MREAMKAPIHEFKSLGKQLGVELLVQRDDLLPFPLAGNKVRKIFAELDELQARPDVLITNGGVDSNHCRTTAMIGAQLGYQVHLVLHGDPEQGPDGPKALEMLKLLGATYEVVVPDVIRSAIDRSVSKLEQSGSNVHVIAGGCHTPAGASSYRDAGLAVFREAQPDVVFVASGTGATQGGLIAAAELGSGPSQVIGVSVARTAERGVGPVREAAMWAGAGIADVVFDDRHRAGGYGQSDERTWEAVRTGWQHGLPLDPTYTGKAFSALLDYARSGQVSGARVLFWHTGGLWNYLSPRCTDPRISRQAGRS